MIKTLRGKVWHEKGPQHYNVSIQIFSVTVPTDVVVPMKEENLLLQTGGMLILNGVYACMDTNAPIPGLTDSGICCSAYSTTDSSTECSQNSCCDSQVGHDRVPSVKAAEDSHAIFVSQLSVIHSPAAEVLSVEDCSVEVTSEFALADSPSFASLTSSTEGLATMESDSNTSLTSLQSSAETQVCVIYSQAVRHCSSN